MIMNILCLRVAFWILNIRTDLRLKNRFKKENKNENWFRNLKKNKKEVLVWLRIECGAIQYPFPSEPVLPPG